ncbi:MAG TPA: Hpt domain-containing protein, partial [Blastocatellia bacterium]|nr:Hpt domain-containing protein [Blastocatellia bacterium]
MEDFTAEELEQLMSVFKDQAASVLDDMAQDILTLEGNGADQEAMARLRRAAHTIKGDSACVGLEGVTGLAHRLEDIIEAARAGALKFDVAVVNVLFESLDEMRAAITGTDVADIDAATLARLLDEIAALEQSADPVDSKTDETETEAAPGAHEDHDAGTGAASNRNGDHASDVVGPTLDAYQREQIKMAIDRGHQTYLLPVETQYFDAVSGAMGASDSLAQPLFELPAENGNGHERRLVIDTAMSPEAFVSWLERELPHPQGSPSWNERVVWVEGTSETGLVISRLAAENASARGGPETNAAKGRRGSEYVRVEAARIDTLLNLAGEMVISRSAMAQVLPDLEAAFPKNDLVARFSSASVQMGKLIAELQKSVLKMRMVTIDHVFRRFNRPMRELASESGKQVDLEISGGETELDRSLVDLIYEPILHLLRNAVDHGLEPTEEREAKGKPKSGKIRMRAYHEGNQVV